MKIELGYYLASKIDGRYEGYTWPSGVENKPYLTLDAALEAKRNVESEDIPSGRTIEILELNEVQLQFGRRPIPNGNGLE